MVFGVSNAKYVSEIPKFLHKRKGELDLIQRVDDHLYPKNDLLVKPIYFSLGKIRRNKASFLEHRLDLTCLFRLSFKDWVIVPAVDRERIIRSVSRAAFSYCHHSLSYWHSRIIRNGRRVRTTGWSTKSRRRGEQCRLEVSELVET